MSLVDAVVDNLPLGAAIKAHNETASANEQISKDDEAVLKKMGFTNGAQLKYFGAERDANPALAKVLKEYTKKFATDPKYDGLLNKMGAQILREGEKNGWDAEKAGKDRTGVVDKLSRDIGNETTIGNFKKTLDKNPQALEAGFGDYVAGKTTLSAMVSPVARDTSVAAKADPKKGEERKAVHHHNAAKPAVTPPASPKPPAEPMVAVAGVSEKIDVNNSKVTDQIVQKMIDTPDDVISKRFDASDVKYLAAGIENYVNTNYSSGSPQDDRMRAKAESFRRAIDGSPALQKQIADRMREDPKFLKDMLRSLKDDPNEDQVKKEEIREATTPILDKILDHPKGLCEKGFLDEIKNDIGDVKKEMMFSGISKMLGIDLKGIMGSAEGFLKGIFRQVSDFLRGLFGNGGLAAMASNRDKGLGQKIALVSNDMSRDPHSKLELDGLGALPNKDGTLFHKETVNGPNGQTIERTVANTVTVQGAGGPVHLIPTNNATVLHAEEGHYKVRVAGTIKSDGSGRISSVDDVWLTQKGYEDYTKAVEERGGNVFVTPNAKQELAGKPSEKPPSTQITYINPEKGHVEETVTVGQTPATAQQDLNTLKKASLDQATMQITPVIGGMGTV